MATKKAVRALPSAKRTAPKAEATAGRPLGSDDRPLTVRQEGFVRAYLENGGNASAAYRAAYDGSKMSQGAIATEAHRLLQLPHVSRIVAAEREKLAKQHGVSAEMVIRELRRIATSDARKLVEWSGRETIEETKGGKVIVRFANDVLIKASAEIDDDTAAAISEIVQTKDGLRVKLHDKLGALTALARHLGLMDDRGESGNITVQIMNFSTMPQQVPALEPKQAPTIERMRALQRGRGNG